MTKRRVCKAFQFHPDTEVDVDISSVIQGVLLGLDRFLKFTHEMKPEFFQAFIKDLTGYYVSLSKNSLNMLLSNKSSTEEFDLLGDYPDLIDACSNYVLAMYDLPKDFSLQSPMHRTSLLIHRRANLAPTLQRLKQFSNTVNANWTDDYLQSYADYFVNNYRPVPEYSDLEMVFDADAKSFKTDVTSISTGVLFGKSRYAFRVDKCMGYEALKEFEEPRFAYLAICAGDEAIVKKMNENFEFTRSCTLMDGPYCDGIVHDTRLVDTIKHEPERFFKELDNM